jgi:hypothetical protein
MTRIFCDLYQLLNEQKRGSYHTASADGIHNLKRTSVDHLESVLHTRIDIFAVRVGGDVAIECWLWSSIVSVTSNVPVSTTTVFAAIGPKMKSYFSSGVNSSQTAKKSSGMLLTTDRPAESWKS